MIRWFFYGLLGVLFVGLVLAAAANGSNYGSGGGGYTQLPACGPAYYGTTLYVQDHWWRCVHATPDHWVLP